MDPKFLFIVVPIYIVSFFGGLCLVFMLKRSKRKSVILRRRPSLINVSRREEIQRAKSIQVDPGHTLHQVVFEQGNEAHSLEQEIYEESDEARSLHQIVDHHCARAAHIALRNANLQNILEKELIKTSLQINYNKDFERRGQRAAQRLAQFAKASKKAVGEQFVYDGDASSHHDYISSMVIEGFRRGGYVETDSDVSSYHSMSVCAEADSASDHASSVADVRDKEDLDPCQTTWSRMNLPQLFYPKVPFLPFEYLL